MAISQEQPPVEIDEALREYLIRFRTDVDNELKKAPKFPERKEMPYKAQIGDAHYFGDIADHSYDAAITDEGFWGNTDSGWRRLDNDAGLACPGVLRFFNQDTTQDDISLVGTALPFFNQDTTQDDIEITCA